MSILSVHLRSDSADTAAFDNGGLSKHGDNIPISASLCYKKYAMIFLIY
jgi:hypothetical protein